MDADSLVALIEKDYLLPRPNFSSQELSRAQVVVGRTRKLEEVMSVGQRWTGATQAIIRDPMTGHCQAGLEKELPTGIGRLSMQRSMGRRENYAIGSSNQAPFQPGGIDEQQILQPDTSTHVVSDALCTVPDGFERGLLAVAEAQMPTPPKDITLAASYYGGVSISEKQAVEDISEEEEEKVDELETIDTSVTRDSGSHHRSRTEGTQQHRQWAHEVDMGAGFGNFERLVPRLAQEFPFELDVFQKRAVYHLERGDSVFVAAHTSAGKTVVAEYAVALAQKHMTKAIYTSPIKALSNQKFQDFSKTFGEDNVGIVTGDIRIRPEAPCVVMTTEVLKNMLYRGADVLRDVEFVVFDECHYVNDLERGVVWEEVIIMLPRHVGLVLLSATVPNTREFAEWVGRTTRRDVYVISTAKRPVPLEHYVYAGGKLHCAVDSSGTFKSGAVAEARKATEGKKGSRGYQGGGGFGSSGAHTGNVAQVVGMLRRKELLPAVVFTFSRKRCEEQAVGLGGTDFLGDQRKRREARTVVDSSLRRLSAEDRKLPQVRVVAEMLQRGIGVHHAGLLPVLKETVEMLFARGLVACLFATETFAMGVNMPARSVVFTALRKHDGRDMRELHPGEYTQMAGRAGRRGLDDTGVVVIAAGAVPETSTLYEMLMGLPTRLQSQFRLTYTMILNLLRARQLRVEDVIRRSFAETHTQQSAPEHERRLAAAKEKLENRSLPPCAICEDDLSTMYSAAATASSFISRMLSFPAVSAASSATTTFASQALMPGRLLLVSSFPYVTLAVVARRPRTPGAPIPCLVFSPAPGFGNSSVRAVPPMPVLDTMATAIKVANSSDLRYALHAIPSLSVVSVLAVAIKPNLLPSSATNVVYEATTSATGPALVVSSTLASGLKSALDSLSAPGSSFEYPWQQIRVLEIQELALERTRVLESVRNVRCTACPDLAEHYLATHERAELQAELDELVIQLSDQNLELLPDYRMRLDVLRALGYVDAGGTVMLKGRVACEITAADELVLTELVLDNSLAQLEPEEIVALLSAFVCPERAEPADLESRLPARLRETRQHVLDAARRVGAIQAAYGLPLSVEEYLREFRFGLMEVAFEWARGMSFLNITSLTDVQEGIIVRCIVRIADVLKNVATAALLVGDTELKRRLQAAAELIRRDIVFAPSLYF